MFEAENSPESDLFVYLTAFLIVNLQYLHP